MSDRRCQLPNCIRLVAIALARQHAPQGAQRVGGCKQKATTAVCHLEALSNGGGVCWGCVRVWRELG